MPRRRRPAPARLRDDDVPAIVREANTRYPRAGKVVDGLVVRDKIPNTDSIEGYFGEHWTLRHVRVVSMADFDAGPGYKSADDIERSKHLAEAIRESQEINPLIVGFERAGPFIIEGGHRHAALYYLGKKEFPALVVVSLDDEEGAAELRESAADDWENALVPGDVRYIPPVVLPQMPDVVARALAAGAKPPLEYIGAGMTGVVFCAGGTAYKVSRTTAPIAHATFEDEAEWLAEAAHVPSVAPHVAAFHRFDPENLVIIRDCPVADPDQSAYRYGEGKLFDLHRRIEAAMLPHGWTSPEFKPDSYVLTTGGPVLVDASMPSRVGEELARYTEAVAAGKRPLWTTTPRDLAFAVRMEGGRTLTQAEVDRLQALIERTWPGTVD